LVWSDREWMPTQMSFRLLAKGVRALIEALGRNLVAKALF
jgi:hypothetical protein